MKKLKKFVVCLLFVFVILFSCGCADIKYQRAVYPNGTIMDAISVKLDEQKISQAGYNIEKVKSDLKIKMQQYLNAVVNSFYNRDDGLLDIEKIAVYNNLRTQVVNQQNVFIASIEFANYNTFRYFYGLHLSEEDSSEEDIVKTFLFNKNVTSGKTIFSGADAEYVTNDFMAYFNNEFSLEDCKFSYLFGTTENKLYSDADYIFEEDGVTYHQWLLTDKDDTISTFTLQVKPVNWYILALVLTGVLLIVLFTISLFLKQKKEPDNFEEEIENILIDKN